ncbi:amino acid ABC transporter ATP-binding protein [Rothia sp. P6271]|uniref:amino acid ABC transporter ATP-binding protein n=1 Tax=Rothia sp. P6271 TaxID=3402659 RepID=UPI003ACA8865
MLSVKNISKSFGEQTILKNLSFDVPDGETTVILGPSGSGKSTLLRCLNLLETPEEGTLTIGSDTVSLSKNLETEDIRRIRSHSAMVFQQFNLFAHYTALKNVALAPVLNGTLSAEKAEALASELLDKVGMKHRADAYPDHLSGGQQQRVAIARALAVNPDYLLFDEPTSALDPELEAEVIRVLIALARENRSLVVVTHNMAFAQKVADRIIFLDQGEIVYEGAPSGFFNSSSERIQKFLNIYDTTDYHI